MIESYTDLKAGTFFLNTVRSKMCWTKTHFFVVLPLCTTVDFKWKKIII